MLRVEAEKLIITISVLVRQHSNWVLCHSITLPRKSILWAGLVLPSLESAFGFLSAVSTVIMCSVLNIYR